MKRRFGRLANRREEMQIQEINADSLLGWYDALDNKPFLLQIVVRKPVGLVIKKSDINCPMDGDDPPA